MGEPKNFQALFFNGEMRKKLKTYSNTRTALSTYVPQPDSGTVGGEIVSESAFSFSCACCIDLKINVTSEQERE